MIAKKKSKKETLTRAQVTKIPGRAHLKRLYAKKDDQIDHKEEGSNSMSAYKENTNDMSRKFLMEKAKHQGIKNFRVLNKAELQQACDIADSLLLKDPNTNVMLNQGIKDIVIIAVRRWQAGWAKNKVAA